MQTKLTDLTVRSLPPGKYFDRTTPAFGIRVGKNRRTWIVMRGADRQLISIGHYPAVTLHDARTEAKRLLATPQPSSGRVSFEEAYTTFKKTHIATKKPSTQRGYTNILERHYLPVLRNKRMSGITTHMLSAITDELVGTPSELHHAQAVSRTFFRWAKRRHYITVNPLEGIQLAKPKRRKRVLTDEELRTVWMATFEMEGDFPEIVRLLVLMGSGAARPPPSPTATTPTINSASPCRANSPRITWNTRSPWDRWHAKYSLGGYGRSARASYCSKPWAQTYRLAAGASAKKRSTRSPGLRLGRCTTYAARSAPTSDG